MRFFPIAIFALVLFSAISCGSAYAASLTGYADWRLAQFRADQGGQAVTRAEHFTQQYSLLYQRDGRWLDGRAGQYDLALGAEWTSVAAEVDGADLDSTAFKMLYRGSILFAPAGLPFRLHLYSHDITPSRLALGSFGHGNLTREPSPTGNLLTPDIVTGIYNGSRVVTGATLMFGIQNGGYQGSYRDTLHHVPRLLADYQQVDVRDRDGATPQHYRQRSLAFVSLNKSKNWFHYRHYDYTDYLDRRNNYVEKTYMLGTIDHSLVRQWVNFTNWIQVSADGSYTLNQQVRSNVERRYDLNLFSVGRHSTWQVSNLNNFYRVTDDQQMRRRLQVPFYVQGEVDRNTAWRFRFVGTRDHSERFDLAVRDWQEDVLFASTRIDTKRQERYVVSPLLEAEVKQGTRGEGYGLRAGVEAYSNRLFAPRHELFGSLSVLRMAGTAADDTDVGFWEEQAIARIASNLTSRTRTGLEQRLVHGHGIIDQSVGTHIRPLSGQSLVFSSAGDVRRSGDVWRSTTTWFGEHSASRRLSNRVETIYDWLSTEDGDDDQLRLRHTLRYDQRPLRGNMRTEVTWGDTVDSSALNLTNLPGGPGGMRAKRTYLHSSSIAYQPSRLWEHDGRFDYYRREGSVGNHDQWRAAQRMRYNLYTANGMIRQLARFGEELEYERAVSTDGRSRSAVTLTLIGDWYPTRRTHFGASTKYRIFGSEDFQELGVFLVASVHFEKVILACDYSYGQRTSTDLIAERNEHRWEVKLRKVF